MQIDDAIDDPACTGSSAAGSAATVHAFDVANGLGASFEAKSPCEIHQFHP
jgi:hypothetical protein